MMDLLIRTAFCIGILLISVLGVFHSLNMRNVRGRTILVILFLLGAAPLLIMDAVSLMSAASDSLALRRAFAFAWFLAVLCLFLSLLKSVWIIAGRLQERIGGRGQ
ncbi:hypothetical protein V1498_02380 [Peribacillus sp. SCS-26]|uniref:hypothetical protein n=1 Tax=Paraperibacillus marinus TaxID=3115295 RepID=UPI003905F3C5